MRIGNRAHVADPTLRQQRELRGHGDCQDGKRPKRIPMIHCLISLICMTISPKNSF